MHDPSVLVFSVRKIRLDVWHDEPNGADSGTVCKGMGGSDLTLHNVFWAIEHRRHLHFRFWPYLRVKCWLIDRCEECGRRFFWKDARHGYMNGDAVYHDKCMALTHVRGNLAEADDYIIDPYSMNSTARWRVEYRLQDRGLVPGQYDRVPTGG
jgi:hypothetical protein